MTTEQFTQSEFEQVLTNNALRWDDLGWMQNERVYHIALSEHCGIRIRSSIGMNGIADATGQNSIRLWLVSNGESLVSKSAQTKIGWEKYVTRVPGWQRRMIEQIDHLRLFQQHVGNCACGYPRIVLVSQTPKNPGRLFSKCSKCGTWGSWLNLQQIERLDQPSLFSVPESQERIPAIEPATNSNGLAFLEDAPNTGFGYAPDPVIIKSSFVPSQYNQSICDFVLNSDKHLRIEAYAGSGKTSNNAWVSSQIPENSKAVEMVVFAKANQLDMEKKIPSWIPAVTTHSRGFADIRRAFGNRVRVDDRKTLNLLKEDYENDYEVRDNYPAIAKLLSLCKNTLREPDTDNLDYLSERYDVQCNGSREIVYDAVGKLWQRSIDSLGRIIDFDDMLFAPAYDIVPVKKCDLLFVDEYQDNNEAQKQYYLKTGARIIFVGDAFQAIYGFRGALIGAMDEMQQVLNAEQLPLPICYRCDKAIIALAQTIVPGIMARDNAEEGLVKYDSTLQMVKAGDMVLCRNNAPLIKPCFESIRNGIKATIKGRDIGNNLVSFLRKIEKKSGSSSFMQLLSDAQDYTDRESAKLDLQHKDSQAASLRDQCETIMALSENCQSMQDLENRVKTIFSDEVSQVTFSTVHKAKGMESDRIFVLKPELLQAQKYDTRDWQLDQLRNLNYVTITRARHELHFIRE